MWEISKTKLGPTAVFNLIDTHVPAHILKRNFFLRMMLESLLENYWKNAITEDDFKTGLMKEINDNLVVLAVYAEAVRLKEQTHGR